MSILRSLTDRLGQVRALDPVVENLQIAISQVRTGAAREVLSGEWLGHPLHPMLTDVVIGTWTSAAIVDLVGGRQARPAADRLVAAGIAAAPPTFASGWSDWLDTGPRDRALARIGVVHAVSNGAALALHVASLRARGEGDRARGVLLSLAGLGLLGASGYLGGHLAYVHGARVERSG
jgi:uncharacterized membrane protein